MPSQSPPELCDRDCLESWDKFHKLIQTLADSPSYNYIQTLSKQNDALTKANETLTKAEEVNLMQISGLGKQLTDEKNRVADKDSEIAQMKSSVQQTQSKMKAAEDALKKKKEELDATAEKISKLMEEQKNYKAKISLLTDFSKKIEKQFQSLVAKEEKVTAEKELMVKQLKEKSDRLKKIESWVCPMESKGKREISEELNNVFIGAYNLAKDYFSHDLPETLCKDISKWDQLWKNPIVGHPQKIPLPSSNSPHAKQMRVIAALAIIADCMTEQIFRPLYILEQGNELFELLRDLASENPDKEVFIRSALLTSITDEEQQAKSEKYTREAASRVFFDIEFLLQDEKRKTFQEDLAGLYTHSCDIWFRIQRLKVKVDWAFDVEEGLCDLLVLPPLTGEVDAKHGDGRNRATKATSPRQTNDAVSSPSPGSKNGVTGSKVDIEHVVGLIWPYFFFAREEEDIELLEKGFALGDDQVKVARGEVASLRRSSTGGPRAARQRARTSSVRNGKDKSFLSSNGSAGLGGG